MYSSDIFWWRGVALVINRLWGLHSCTFKNRVQQNISVERDLQGSSGPTAWPMQGWPKVKRVVKGVVQIALKRSHALGIDHLSKKPVPVPDHSLCEEMFPKIFPFWIHIHNNDQQGLPQLNYMLSKLLHLSIFYWIRQLPIPVVTFY